MALFKLAISPYPGCASRMAVFGLRTRVFLLLLFSLACSASYTASAQVFTTTAGAPGNWSNAAIWLENGLPTTNIPNASNSTSITVSRNLAVDVDVTIDQATITTGTLTINSGRTLTVADGTGDDLTLGTVGAAAGVITTTGSLAFQSNATFNLARNSGTIPLATWGSGSLCKVTGNTGAIVVTAGNTFQNFEWNCPTQSTTRTVNGGLGGTTSINGNLTVTNTNGSQFRLTGNTTFSLTVGGNLTISAGTLNLSSGTGLATINLKGDFVLASGATLTESGGGNNSTIVFDRSPAAVQNITAQGTISNAVNFTINNSAGVSLTADATLPGTTGTLTQTLGNVALNEKQLTLQGSLSQQPGASILVGSSTSTTAALVISGSGTLPATTNIQNNYLTKLELNRSAVTFNPNATLNVLTFNLFNGSYDNSTSTLVMMNGGTLTRTQTSATLLTNSPSVALPFSDQYNIVYNNAAALTTGLELTASTSQINDFTKTLAGALNLNQAVTINGDLTVSAGTLACAANNVTLNGNYTSNGTLTTSAGQTFTLGGTTLLSGATTPAFRNLTVNGTFTPSMSYNVSGNYTVGNSAVVNAGSGTVTFNGTTVVTNSGTMNLNVVTIAAGSSLTAPATSMGIAGAFTVNGTSTFTNNNGTIVFNSPLASLAGTGTKTFNNISVTDGSTLSGTVSWGFNGTLNTNTSGAVSFTAGTCTTAGASATISGSGTVTLNALTISSGSLSCGSISLRGAFTGTGNFTSTGTVTFANATTMTGAGTKNFSAIAVNTGASFTPNAAYTITGAITVTGTGVLNSGNSTTTFDGASTISGTSTSISFNNVTINASRTVNATSDITVNGNLVGNGDITSSARVTFVGLTMSGGGAKTFTDVTVGAGTLTPNCSYTINGNLTMTGTLAAGTGTATFGGNTTISGAGTCSFNNVLITGNLTSRPVASGVVTVQGNFTNNGTVSSFNANGGTITFGATATQKNIQGSAGITFFNLTISNNGSNPDVINSINSDQTVILTGLLTLSGANATFDADGSGNSPFVIASTNDSPSSDGRVATITATTSSITGNFTVQRYVSSEGRIYRYISAPVVGSTVSQLKAAIPVTGGFLDPSNALSTPPCATPCTSASTSLYRYDASTQAYEAFPGAGILSTDNPAALFESGRGYSAFFRHTGSGAVGTVTINFSGTNPTPVNGTGGLGMTLTVAAAANGWSLVGNPYPSPIVWNNTNWAKTNIQDQIVVRDNAGTDQTYSAAAGTGIIAPGQAFWVQTSAAGGGSLRILETAKVASPGTYSFYKEGDPIEDEISLVLTKASDNSTNAARIRLISDATQAYDSYDFDALSFYNGNVSASLLTPDISTLASDAKILKINSIPAIACNQVFNINSVNLVQASETTVNFSIGINLSGSPKGLTWTLHDNYTNTDFNLASGPYNFVADKNISASISASRFYVTVSNTPIDTNLALTSNGQACASSNPFVTVSGSQAGMTYGVEVNGTDYYPNVAQGNGEDINVTVKSEWLTAGTNSIRIKVNSGCEVAFLSGTVQIEKAADVTPVAGNVAACKAGSVTLTASGAISASNYRWYASETSGDVLATGASFETPYLTDTTTYYVAAFNAYGCDGPRVPVMAYVNDLASGINVLASNPVVCRNNAISFTASHLQSGTFKWYETSTSTDALASGVSFTTPELLKSRSYYLTFTDANNCESAAIQLLVPVSNFSPVLGADNDLSGKLACKGGTYVFTANGAPAGASYAWFESPDGGDLVAETAVFKTPALTSSKTYYLAAKNEAGCYSDRYPVDAVVDSSDPVPDFTSAIYDPVCEDKGVSVSLSGGSASDYRWYESSTSTDAVNQGKKFDTNVFDQDRKFYIAAINANGCEGSARKEIIVSVKKVPEPVIEINGTQLKSSVLAGNQWYYEGQELAGESGPELTVSQPGAYAVAVTSDGCVKSSVPVLALDFVTGLEEPQQAVEVYPNPASDFIRIHIATTEVISCKMFDERGVAIQTVSLAPAESGWKGELNVQGLSKGMYFLRIQSQDKTVTHKVIIR